MWQLLIHAKTFARVENALRPFADQISPLVLDDEGDLKQAWGKSEAKALIAYGTPDAYFSPSVITFFHTMFDADTLDWFQSSAAGTEHPMIQATGKKAKLFSGSHEQSEAIAEWVLWAGLDFHQHGHGRREAQASKTWMRLPFRELASSNWLIIGFGAIGQACGRRLRALGATVTGVRRRTGDNDAADHMIQPSGIQTALPDMDAVVLCLPLTDDTENMVDHEFLGRMKADSVLINVGRGGLVDVTARLSALDQNTPARAYLDVVKEEPLPTDDPIWSHPKVTLTAHISALTDGSKTRTDQVFLENLSNFLNHRPLRNAVSSETFAEK